LSVFDFVRLASFLVEALLLLLLLLLLELDLDEVEKEVKEPGGVSWEGLVAFPLVVVSVATIKFHSLQLRPIALPHKQHSEHSTAKGRPDLALPPEVAAEEKEAGDRADLVYSGLEKKAEEQLEQAV
jgi:hypothetical protein